MDDLRKLQLIQTETLEEIISICKKHNIKYFLLFGTLLGAVRHGGFIPWDDDLDIGILRNDYNRFVSILCEEISKEFFIHNQDTDPNYFAPFTRVRRNDTTFIPEAYRYTNFVNNGVWIDIFPIDEASAPDNITEKLRFNIYHKFWMALASYNALGKREKRGIKTNLVYRLSKCFSLRSILLHMDNLTVKKKGNYEYYTCYYSLYKVDRNYYPKSSFGEGVIHLFEGIPCNIPEDADKVLSILYGDYMKLPPEDQRVGHLPVQYDFSKVEPKNRKE